MNKSILTVDRLKALLKYDLESGVFTRKIGGRGTGRVGAIAGTPHSEGYIHIMIDGTLHYAHRLAWLHEHGSFPKNQLDHINGDRSDNRIANLRECTNAQNHQNRGPHSRNKSGYPGVSWHKGRKKWEAKIAINGSSYYLGLFRTREEAAAAYVAAKKSLHTFNPESRRSPNEPKT